MAGDFDPNVCTQTLTNEGFAPLCPQDSCAAFQETPLYHAVCAQQPIYFPVQQLGCYEATSGQWEFATPNTILQVCLQLHEQDAGWNPMMCYCCCTGGGSGEATVATPEGETAAGYVKPGDEVSGGSVGPGGELRWGPVTVGLSHAVSSRDEPLVRLVYGDDGLVATPDQLFMLADRSLVRAESLAPEHELVDPQGRPVPLTEVGRARGCGDVQLIATETRWNGSPDGHLLALGGVVAGDYTLQLHWGAAREKR
jgi:hypothetical protein